MKSSAIIIGTMRLGKWGANFSTSEYERFVDACLDLGLQDFDHADIYGDYTTEFDFGNLIRKRPDLKSKIQITTKCGIRRLCTARPDHKLNSYDSSPEHIIDSVEQSLTNLSVDKIDMLLLHRPDFLLDTKAVRDCFEQLRQEGKVLNFGVSNYSSSQLDLLNSDFPLSMHQIEISLKNYNAFFNGTLDFCQKEGINVSAWSPMGGGDLLLSQKQEYANIRSLSKKLSEKYSCSPSQIVLAWLNPHPCNIIPVIGTSKIKRVEEALEASKIQISREDWYALLEASRNHEVL